MAWTTAATFKSSAAPADSPSAAVPAAPVGHSKLSAGSDASTDVEVLTLRPRYRPAQPASLRSLRSGTRAGEHFPQGVLHTSSEPSDASSRFAAQCVRTGARAS